MLTLNAAGKSGNEAVNFVRASLSNDEDELRILIEGPAQAEGITKFLKSQGFNDVVPEDDDGLLFLIATKKAPEHKPESKQPPIPEVPAVLKHESVSSGVLISSEAKKYKHSFLQKFISSLLNTNPKPEVIALMNSSVKLAEYSSESCDNLKELESQGVSILVSESCADTLGISEAIGVGVMCSMSEILGKIFSCEKVVSV